MIISLSFATFLNASCQHQEKAVVKSATFTITEDDPGPPPISIVNSKPVTLKQWFFKLCDERLETRTKVSYKFDFLETGNVYEIGLIDLDKLGKDVQQYYEPKNIKPQGKFFAILKNEYKDLKWQQVLDRIKAQLKEYSRTEKFRQSSLAKAKSITIKFDDNGVIDLKDMVFSDFSLYRLKVVVQNFAQKQKTFFLGRCLNSN